MADGRSTDDRRRVVADVFGQAIRLHEQVMDLDPAPVLAAADAIARTLTARRTLFVFGNGGSAADAQHLAAEFVGRFTSDRPARPVIALTADASVVTSISNDYGFDHVFARQIEAFAGGGDVAFGISTSGESPNVLNALTTAETLGLTRIALTGRDGGPIGRAANIHVNVPHGATPRVQEVHRTLLHVICELVERALAR